MHCRDPCRLLELAVEVNHGAAVDVDADVDADAGRCRRCQ
jgi:hypothetical protein